MKWTRMDTRINFLEVQSRESHSKRMKTINTRAPCKNSYGCSKKKETVRVKGVKQFDDSLSQAQSDGYMCFI